MFAATVAGNQLNTVLSGRVFLIGLCKRLLQPIASATEAFKTMQRPDLGHIAVQFMTDGRHH